MARNSKDMKISGSNEITPTSPLSNVQSASSVKRKTFIDEITGEEGSISVHISESSKSLKAAIGSIPDIRIEFITEIKDSIDNGSYERDSAVIARKVVNEFLFESIKQRQRGKPR